MSRRPTTVLRRSTVTTKGPDDANIGLARRLSKGGGHGRGLTTAMFAN
jgi:hypothetical protein